MLETQLAMGLEGNGSSIPISLAQSLEGLHWKECMMMTKRSDGLEVREKGKEGVSNWTVECDFGI